MSKRFMAIWFRHLTTDWFVLRQPELKGLPFVLAAPERGRMVAKAVSAPAKAKGIETGMVVADARAVFPSLQVLPDKPELAGKLLHALAHWCLRFTPAVAADHPDGLILDITGCAHLWNGEGFYLKDIVTRLRTAGYDVRAAIADTVGAAWAVSRYGQVTPIVEPGEQIDALRCLPPAALRLEPGSLQRMEKLGFYQISNFINMPRAALRRRFGPALLTRLGQALGAEVEKLELIQVIQPYQERLPALEPIRTAKGIEMALRQLLELLCQRLLKDGKGLRAATFKGFRVDNNLQQITIGTNRASRSVAHLFRLFELHIQTITPALGIELFIIEASVVEDLSVLQESLWNNTEGKGDAAVAELLDRLTSKIGSNVITRYVPQEHYWPERSIKIAESLYEKTTTAWRNDLSRPMHLLPHPEAIEVTVPIPDYPPLSFQYKGKLHRVLKADGPERIEQEWWLEEGLHRDYYVVEDEQGCRYWLFRLGHYHDEESSWFMHGFFA